MRLRRGLPVHHEEFEKLGLKQLEFDHTCLDIGAKLTSGFAREIERLHLM
jgi:hypothetical protein